VTPEPHAAAEQAIRGVRAGPLFAEAEHLDEVDSTNRYLADAALAGAAEGRAVVARRQTAGRGRLGRQWLDVPGGSFLCSLLFRPPLPAASWQLVAWTVALSAREAIEAVTGVKTSFKWPNDLLVGDAKVAGVLGELAPPDGLVVGIGVNCNWPPDWPPSELAGRATALGRVSGSPVDLSALEKEFLAGVSERYRRLLSGEHGEIAAEYRRGLSTLGRMVRVELPSEQIVGRAVDLDEEGHLLVEVAGAETEDGGGPTTSIRPVSAGDVVHLREQGENRPEG
jgi:BirA family biotin operon repressor/biotin-[acetyl-CoA-carboxylase] ligase